MSDGIRRDDPIGWLNDALWPDGTAALVPGPPRRAATPSWWASPSTRAAQVLIPTGPPGAVRGAVRRYHDGQAPRRRVRSAAAEIGARSGPLAPAALGGRSVHLDGDRHGGIPGAIAAAMGLGDLHFAVSLGQPKSNRKPVLQLFDDGGRCVGFAKVAWDQRSAGLVRNEAAWLRRRPQRPLSTPAIVVELEAHGHPVVVQTALRGGRLPRRRTTTPPPALVFRRVAELGARTASTVVATPWWRSVEVAALAADDRERAAIEAVRGEVGDQVVQTGAWHGDLAPWNLLSTHRLVHLIDWELAADGFPVGFDRCHFHTQSGVELLGLTAPAALARAARLAAGVVGPAVWACYLVELVRRRVELRSTGWPAHRVRLGAAALDLLAPGPAGVAAAPALAGPVR